MAIEQFTKTQFEEALPKSKFDGRPLWSYLGLVDAEETYAVRINPHCQIVIRSSVKPNGTAADCGKDSIRAWLAYTDGQPMGSKIQSYVTRVPGWDTRLLTVLRELYRRAHEAGACPTCDKPMGVFKVKKEGANKGRLFCKCREHNHFRWLDEPIPAGYYAKPEDKEPAVALPDDSSMREYLESYSTIKARVAALKELMAEDKNVAIWGMLTVYSKQTAYEQQAEVTEEFNGVGFTGLDAELLSSYSKQFEKKGDLSVKQMKYVFKKMPKYAVQIEKIMRGKL